MWKDRKDLIIKLLEILYEFCQFHLGPMYKSWFEAETEQLYLRRRQLIDRTMIKEGFVKEKRLERIYFDKEMLNLLRHVWVRQIGTRKPFHENDIMYVLVW